MRKAISYILSFFTYFFFISFLLIFHPIQWVCLKIGGYSAHKKSVDYLVFFSMKCFRILGTKITFNQPHQLPDAPLIVVSNHQSTLDVPPIMWYLRKHHIKFVAKKELSKGVPSISFNLKHGGSALIDRKDRNQAVNAIKKMCGNIEKNNYSVVIFPEGTRSRNGVPKPFRKTGLKTLVQNIPSAYILPITINNAWKVTRYGSFPLGIGTNVTFDVHKPIKANDVPFDILFEKAEKTIVDAIVL